MAGGRGNKAIELLDPDLRAKIDALIYMGTPVTEIYDQFPAVQSAMQLRTLQEYAKDLRDAQQLEIIAANKRVLQKLLAEFGDEAEHATEMERVALGTAIKLMLGEGKDSTKANGVDAFLQIHKHWRKAEEHRLRMRMQEHLLQKIGAAARAEEGTGKQVVDLATVARLMSEVDQAA